MRGCRHRAEGTDALPQWYQSPGLSESPGRACYPSHRAKRIRATGERLWGKDYGVGALSVRAVGQEDRSAPWAQGIRRTVVSARVLEAAVQRASGLVSGRL